MFDEISPADNITQILGYTLDKLENSTNVRIDLYEYGRMLVSDNNGTPGPTDDIHLHILHNFTHSNGYQYRDGTVFKPDGTELFAD
jgi:hypothetical protein